MHAYDAYEMHAYWEMYAYELAIVRKKSPPAKTARDKRIAYFGKALLRYGYFGGGQLPVPHPKCDMFIE